MITESLNPAQFNGFIFCLGQSTIYGEQIQTIKNIGLSGKFDEGCGRVIKKNIIENYCNFVAGNIKLG